ncbi:DUF2691 family protein [Paenibacillus sinopodophylli]|uniref:DUF2691 family protein n=1 Tax=Paenibacillus sinopodophylli TaxID=1837342 RepID=UPI00110D016E|nr:DUF2691 family protein [Paenibacillus sinopodophylli]
MNRGMTFRITNGFGKFLGEALQPFNTTEFNWYIGGEEAYFVEDAELGEPLFSGEIYGMDGTFLKERLENNEYYIIFANFKAFPKEKQVIDVLTYEAFLNSDCHCVVLVADCEYVTIYCKDQGKLADLYNNAQQKKYLDVEFITNDNDSRTGLRV